MVTISDLPDELLVKILSFLPTEVAVSTSILSKRWEFLWMWLSDLEFDCNKRSVRDFINKNLPLHRSPIINRLFLTFLERTPEDETKNFKSWVEIAVSRGVRELICDSYTFAYYKRQIGSLVLTTSLYTCNSLVTLKLDGGRILVDVPQIVCLPSLKNLHLSCVTYANEDSLRLLLRSCPVLEYLIIEREREDNVGVLVIKIPSLLRLSIIDASSSGEYVIVTPSLKYLRIKDYTGDIPYLFEHMPELEEADIDVFDDIDIGKIFKSITTVKRLSLHITFVKAVYGNDIVFSRLENLKLCIYERYWSEIVYRLLKDSPNLQILDLEIHNEYEFYGAYDPVSWSSNESLVPECLLKSLKTFKFKGSTREEEEERNFISFISKHACCLESTSILP